MITEATEAKHGWGVLAPSPDCPVCEVIPTAVDRSTIAEGHIRGLRCPCQSRYNVDPNSAYDTAQVILVHRLLMSDFEDEEQK